MSAPDLSPEPITFKSDDPFMERVGRMNYAVKKFRERTGLVRGFTVFLTRDGYTDLDTGYAGREDVMVATGAVVKLSTHGKEGHT